jgi:hypothetical protein
MTFTFDGCGVSRCGAGSLSLLLTVFLLLFLFLLELSFHEEVVAGRLLFLIFLGGELVDAWTEVGRVATESDIHELEELVHTADKTLWGCAPGFLGGDTVEDDDLVGKIGSHDEIVLYNESTTLLVDDPTFHDLRGTDSLL